MLACWLNMHHDYVDETGIFSSLLLEVLFEPTCSNSAAAAAVAMVGNEEERADFGLFFPSWLTKNTDALKKAAAAVRVI